MASQRRGSSAASKKRSGSSKQKEGPSNGRLVGNERIVACGGIDFFVPKKYTALKAIGRGSYGVVASATDTLLAADAEKDNEVNPRVAIKRISPISQSSSDAKHVLRELRLMRHLGKHPNVITLRDCVVKEDRDELYLVMELMDSDLHRVIQSPQALTEAHARYFMIQLLRGVHFMHENRIIHRDLKPGNLLVSRNCDLRITDFGLARERPSGPRRDTPDEGVIDPMTEHVVTRWYRPPELMLCPDGLYTYAVDLWSCGCILAELLGRRPLFPGKNFVHQLQLIFDVIGAPRSEEVAHIRSSQARRFLQTVQEKRRVPFAVLYPNSSPAAHDLIGRLLVFDEKKRLGTDKAMAHSFFDPLVYGREDGGKMADAAYPRGRVSGLDFDFEEGRVSKSALRRMLHDEAHGFRAERKEARLRRRRSSASRAATHNDDESAASGRGRPGSGGSNSTASSSRSSEKLAAARERAAIINERLDRPARELPVAYQPSTPPPVPPAAAAPQQQNLTGGRGRGGGEKSSAAARVKAARGHAQVRGRSASASRFRESRKPPVPRQRSSSRNPEEDRARTVTASATARARALGAARMEYERKLQLRREAEHQKAKRQGTAPARFSNAPQRFAAPQPDPSAKASALDDIADGIAPARSPDSFGAEKDLIEALPKRHSELEAAKAWLSSGHKTLAEVQAEHKANADAEAAAEAKREAQARADAAERAELEAEAKAAAQAEAAQRERALSRVTMAAEKKLDEERRIEEAAKPKQLPWREKLVALRRARGQEQLEKAKAHARGEYPFDDEDGSAAEEKEAAEARARARRPNTGVSSLADTVSVEEENRGAAEVAARVLAGGSAQRSPLTPSSKANKRSHWGADAEDESDSRASTAKAAHGADGGRLTVPQSPNFTKMSWQRQHPRPRAPTQVASSRVPAQVSSRAPAQASSSAGKGQKARPRRRRSKSTGAKKRGSGGSQTSLGAAGTTGLGLTGTAKGAALQERSHGLTRMRARLHAGYY